MEETPVIGKVRVGKIVRPKCYKFCYGKENERDRLIYVNQGTLLIRCAGERISVKSGECVYLCAKYESETEFLGEENEIYLFWFLCYAGTIGAPLRVCSVNNSIKALIKKAKEENAPPCRMLSYLYEILHYLIEVPLVEKGEIRYVLRYIETHFAEEKKVSEYAAMCYMSESHFRKRFVDMTGKSPIAYRNDLRLRRAEELVGEGYSHAEAAHTVGFSSVHFYCRLKAREKKQLLSGVAVSPDKML